MSKLSIAFSLILAATSPSILLAEDDTDWKPESEESALQFLEQGRRKLGKLCRFEIECLRNNVGAGHEVEEWARLHVYCEESIGYLCEVRAIDPRFMQTSRQTCDGRPYPVRSERSETWLLANGHLTFLDEVRRTFMVTPADRDIIFLGSLVSTDLPHGFIPPWFDPSVDWNELKARFRIDRAQSTVKRFYVEFVPLVRNSALGIGDDERLKGHQRIYVDRKSLRPTKWFKKDEFGSEQTLVYTRFDANPPRRELKVSLAGYKDVNTLPKPSPKEDPKPAINTESLEIGARILFWLLF
jgi:hypothetical protein